MSNFLYNGIGTFGVFCCLLAFFLLQIGKIDAKKLAYSLLNFIGSTGIIISLCYQWNFSAALMEITWALISVYGILLFYLRKHCGTSSCSSQ